MYQKFTMLYITKILCHILYKKIAAFHLENVCDSFDFAYFCPLLCFVRTTLRQGNIHRTPAMHHIFTDMRINPYAMLHPIG